MNAIKNIIYFVSPMIMLFPLFVQGQNQQLMDTSQVSLKKVAREIIHSRGTCALITVDEKGLPRVRMMDPFSPEEDFTIWFATNPKSRKVEQLHKNPRVTIKYGADDQSGYVSIYGKAELIHELSEKEKHWKEKWKAFYPNWPNDYLLIKVKPQWMEIISIPHGINGNIVTWRPPAVSFEKK